jgi:branched-chain amino acid aminotransferase
MANLCNLDGAILPESEASVPVLDRSFLFGDSVYEVVRTIGGVPFAWAEHWQRLARSAADLWMPLDLDERTVARRIQDTLAAAGNPESYVRIVVTRGTGTAPNIDLAYAEGPRRWVILVRQLGNSFGMAAKLARIPRLRNDRRALDPASKSGNYLNNVMGLAEAKKAGATDCVMLNADGMVTEASTSNLFARIGGQWVTPPLDAGILAGITRAMLIEHLRAGGESVVERPMSSEDLDRAEELFLSSTLRDVGPVTHLDGIAKSGGRAGPHTERLMTSFATFLRERMGGHDGPRWRKLVAE